MNDELANRIAAFLDAYHVMSLATHGPDGPHAANLFYVRDGLSLVWISEPDTRHSRDIAADQRVSACANPSAAFRALKVPLDHPGVRGKNLAPLDPQPAPVLPPQ